MTDPLDTFRRAAKVLKSSYEAGDLTARERLRAYPPRAGDALKHADFLHVIARENSFATWPAMKGAIETLGLERAAKLQRLKIALHQGQTGVVRRLIDDTPDLAADHFGLLCGLYDVKSVWAMLTKDPGLAIAPAGPSLPLVHLAKSRMFTVWPDKAAYAVAIADMLVANGADVNAGSVEHGDPLSPLYWALGHAGNIALAQWLLEAGANPNDDESLYHATELGHVQGVKLLLSHGADPKGTNALPRALDFDNADMVALLLDGGAKPNDAANGVIPSLHQAARRMNSGTVCDLLLENGADPAALWNGHSAYAFATVFGNAGLARRIEERGQAIPLSATEDMLAVAATGQVPDGYIDTAKLPDAYRNILREILHLPDKISHLKALVAIGLEWDRPDDAGVTPVQAAGWNGLPDVMAYFLSLAPDLGHTNSYGGTLLSTIIHGSENNPLRASADYVGCLQLALEHGVALPKRAIEMAGNDDLRALMQQWARDRPGQVVAHGPV
ncbi:ankyrin repeat domain-containing protein [Octadecabacter sp. G9-8]|uniref:Ankyrin repeat domain-containing protein n=1 Tax=Octadecabacter dasysiphoniae TaxID=2909341 RepID=A0ABS9CV49_9RHOB|nr:ankyrin repeat domain-containing protein [Octadecabacter dasysiphoniae]MCF2871114.1 ankyrin repeat domain-containing protein [Octadecabacter dasysiphoniae]